jgi:competence protein ComEA
MHIDELREKLLDFSEDQRRAIISIGLIAILIASFFALASRGQSVEASEPLQKVVVQGDNSLLVHVVGKVLRPGVYPMVSGARVNDAIAAAGGALKGVDLSEINLARKVVDGEQIYVGIESFTKNSSGSTRVGSGKININRANASQFESLPKIGPVIAKRIMDYRKLNGQFAALEDIQKVTGIGAKTFARIKDRITL